MAVNQIEAMKASFTFLIILCFYIAEAQLKITPERSLHLTGNAQLTSQNMSFVNNVLQLGDITPGTYFLTATDAKGKELFSNTFLKR